MEEIMNNYLKWLTEEKDKASKLKTQFDNKKDTHKHVYYYGAEMALSDCIHVLEKILKG